MILIIGGFAAGKYEFAQTLGFQDSDIFELSDENTLMENLTNKPVVIVQEMGCGMVPIDATERDKREKMGRLACELAKEATAVYRVTCGLGAQIK